MGVTLLRRSDEREILDGEDYTPDELAGNLADMATYGRITGGGAVIAREIGALCGDLAPGSIVSILDVGAGAASLTEHLARWARRRGLRPRVVACDLSERILALAKGSRHARTARLCRADAASLPHADGAFDVACSSLLLHHLDRRAATTALGEMARVARRGVVVLDLRRSALAFASVWALTRLTSLNRVTRADGPLSVRRAWTPAEALALVSGPPPASAGSLPAPPSPRRLWEVRRHGPARLVMICRKDGAAPSSRRDLDKEAIR